jgi:homeodomain-containing protein
VPRVAAPIELSDEERSELQRRAASLKLPYRVVVRAKIVLLAAEGLSNVEIAGRVDMSADRVGAGEDASASGGLRGLRTERGRDARAVFPPEEVAQVKAVACQPPSQGALLSRRSAADIHRLVVERGICAVSRSTIWRWLAEDAIKPWQTRSWIFPRDPDFAQKAGRVLDLYARTFEGKLLRPGEYVICGG